MSKNCKNITLINCKNIKKRLFKTDFLCYYNIGFVCNFEGKVEL